MTQEFGRGLDADAEKISLMNEVAGLLVGLLVRVAYEELETDLSRLHIAFADIPK